MGSWAFYNQNFYNLSTLSYTQGISIIVIYATMTDKMPQCIVSQ